MTDVNDHRRNLAWRAGCKARLAGKPETANNRQRGTIYYDDWADGWRNAALTKPTPPASASDDCGNLGWCHAPGQCSRHDEAGTHIAEHLTVANATPAAVGGERDYGRAALLINIMRERWETVAQALNDIEGGMHADLEDAASAMATACDEPARTIAATPSTIGAREVERLRETLRKIASCESYHPKDVVALARAALAASPVPVDASGAGDLIDRAALKAKLDELIAAASRQWGAGSTEHNLIRDVSDVVSRVPAHTSDQPQ